MLDIKNKIDCNGCCACVDICPPGSITLKTDIEGFWYPEINLETCTDCGLCDSTCPELHANELSKNDYEKPRTYAAVHKNLEVRFDSTSGGFFSALAGKMYNDGGYVGGAIYNDDFSVRHFISNDKKDLPQLRSSKYLQSNASGLYNNIKQLLKDDEKVLVCGTPCQMAGLRLFLNKDYENLIIVDFVCRGVNSPKVFRKYLDSIEEQMDSKINYVKAKSKELGWRNLTWKFGFKNGKNLFQPKGENLFTRGYIDTNAYCRPSCYDCKFKGFPRIADISIADFWGIENVDKSLDNDLGTSMVLINSKKGEEYFEQVKPRIHSKEVEFETILPGNPVLTDSLDSPTIDRNEFFKDLEHSSFSDVANKYFPFPKISKKQQIKKLLKVLLELKYYSRLHPKPLFQFLKYNFLSKAVSTNWLNGGLIIPSRNTVFQIEKGAEIICNNMFRFGFKKFHRSKLESRLLVEKGGKLEVKDDFRFFYGADIEIFEGGELIIEGGGSDANINATIICAEKIVLGKGVQIGRNVTIRDNNGGHYIARQGYKNSRPVIIGDHAWLGEGCTIMPGVKIGEGAIIGARSLVVSNVPANTIVSGNPAEVIDIDVLWKY